MRRLTQIRALSLALIVSAALAPPARCQSPPKPDTVIVPSGPLTLRGILWRPAGDGPFPAIMFNHGGYATEGGETLGSEPAILGPVFAKHGYVLLFLCRRGVGLSADQGPAEGDLMSRALTDSGQDGRNRVQLQLLETEALNEATAGLEFLRALPAVDARRIGLAGHSFGGSLTLFVAARDTTVRAAVLFAGAAYSWERSPALRNSLLAAVDHSTAPVLFLHAANDYSTTSGKALAAEMQRLGRPHRLKIYPAVGTTPREGHNFVFGSVATWEPDVFAFLGEYLRR